MKKPLIIVGLVVAGLIILALGFYGSLHLFSGQNALPDDEILEPMDMTDIQKMLDYISIEEWDQYSAYVPEQVVRSEFFHQAEVLMAEWSLDQDIELKGFSLADEAAIVHLRVQQGFLSVPAHVQFTIEHTADTVTVMLDKVRAGWVAVPLSWLSIGAEHQQITFNIQDYMPQPIPIQIDRISIQPDGLYANASIDHTAAQEIIADAITRIPEEYAMDVRIPDIEHQTIELKSEDINEPFNEYLNEVIQTTSLPLGLQINKTTLDMDTMIIVFDIQWLILQTQLEAQLNMFVQDNILYYEVESATIAGADIDESLIDFIENVVGGFQFDLYAQGMPPWIAMHSVTPDAGNILIDFSIDADKYYAMYDTADRDAIESFYEQFGLTPGTQIEIRLTYDDVETMADNILPQLIADRDYIQQVDLDLADQSAQSLIAAYGVEVSIAFSYQISAMENRLLIHALPTHVIVEGFTIPEEDLTALFPQAAQTAVALDHLLPAGGPQLYSIRFTDDGIYVIIEF